MSSLRLTRPTSIKTEQGFLYLQMFQFFKLKHKPHAHVAVCAQAPTEQRMVVFKWHKGYLLGFLPPLPSLAAMREENSVSISRKKQFELSRTEHLALPGCSLPQPSALH